MNPLDDQSLVYGVIMDDPSADLNYLHKARKRNIEVLASLQYSNYPWLKPEMFQAQGGFGFNGLHQPQLIQFAMSSPGLEFVWQGFMRHFEQLLADLYWTSVRLQLETELSGRHQFFWHPETSRHCPGQAMSLHCQWQYEHSLSGVG